jgi:hypothetical protein
MFRNAVLLLLVTAWSAAAQVQSRPTDPPLVTAASERWFMMREPIDLGGELYYPAGARRYFDGNTMVRSGHYNGVPIYSDTTVEPYSIVFVPATRGVMQPYERLRRNDLAGTTGSRTPSFPVRAVAERAGPAMAPVSPSGPPITMGALRVYTSEANVAEAARADDAAMRATTPLSLDSILTPGPQRQDVPIVSLMRPESNDGVWVPFKGEKWISAGAAIPLRASEFRAVGEYAGFPVFIRIVNGTIQDDMIYLPTRAGLVAPYKLK